MPLPPRYSALTLTLDFERREDMWERIDRRVDRMMAAGLAEEVRALLRSGVPERCTAMQAIGYKENTSRARTIRLASLGWSRAADSGSTPDNSFIGYKEMAAALRAGGDTAAAAEEIKLRSRQYSKRQRTWFRRNPQARPIFWGPQMICCLPSLLRTTVKASKPVMQPRI